MKTTLVQIGDSRGIRIPRAFLEQCHLDDQVELELRHDHLVIRPARQPRSGWDDTFRQMREHGDDTLLDEASLTTTEWDATEWERTQGKRIWVQKPVCTSCRA